jgi:hypothetical protein
MIRYDMVDTMGVKQRIEALLKQSDTPGKAGGLFCEPLKAVCLGTA